jgi:glucose-6-phosphate dehydrogenase assembly protein OpcA
VSPGSSIPAGAAPAGDPFLLLGEDGRREFDATALEHEMRSMWKSPPGSNAFYRAALANVVVPLDQVRSESLAAVLGDMARLHPARLFRIQRAGEASPGSPRLTARATALCHVREGAAGFVCSEQIVLEWTDASAALVPSAVRSLLIGDLPVILLSLVPGPEPAWVPALAAKADLVIADSCLEEEPAALVEIWERTGRSGTPMRDLAWARLEPWRSLIAEIFDAPGAARALGSLRDLKIAHGGAAPPSTGWLLAGWLASRLEWRLEARDGARWRFASTHGPVDVIFERDEKEPAAVLRWIHLRAAGGHPLDVRIAHLSRETTAVVEWLAPREAVVQAPFGHRELAAAIVGEIQRQDPNPTFQEAARIARAMIEA